LILLNIVDRAYSKTVIDKIKANNVPVILFNREPLTSVPIQSYGRAIYILELIQCRQVFYRGRC
ncbi:hypothetical protein QUW38_13520, partial [Clostridium butyricum]|nr:hypothetical protein [Clostridium butyricum]MDM8230468.1 hypothetical protein [Clostridium butyricum]